MKLKKQFRIVIAVVATGLVSIFANSASAQVTGWGLETGFQAATLTEGSPGSFSVSQPTGNAGARADFSSIDFSTIGTTVDLSGTVAFSGLQAFGNQSFRFGLFNNNGNALGTLSGGLWSGATPSGWLGYIVEAGNGNGAGTTPTFGRNGSGANAWLSTSGASYALTPNGTQTGTYTSGASAIFTFDMTLTRLSATSVSITYSLINTTGGAGSDYSVTGSVVDSGGLSSGIASFNAVGFLLNGSSGGAASFSNVNVVTVVPEPSTVALCAIGMAGLVVFRCRGGLKKI